MQHIYSRAQNLGNECAEHAAALGAFGLVSNQDMSARWARPLFDCISCFSTCDSLRDVLDKLRDVRTARASASQQEQVFGCRFILDLLVTCLVSMFVFLILCCFVVWLSRCRRSLRRKALFDNGGA